MRAILLVVVVILAVGLSVTVDRPVNKLHTVQHTEASGAATAVGLGPHRVASSIAAYPDRGVLLASDHKRRVVRSGASTWHPVHVSEEHALRAIAGGGMTVPASNGESIRLRYERHFEHPDGNWTWIGREEGAKPGAETVLTFGEKAVFGVIRQANADLRLTTEAGSVWLVETDYNRVDRNRLAANDDDFVVPVGMPKPEPPSRPASIRAAGSSAEQIGSVAAIEATASTTVDIAMGFTTGFAARLGGESQARTRLNFLVDVTNQAYTASGIDAQIRLVHSLQVNYPDATHNRTALFDLTGVDCTTQANGAHYLSDRRVDCTQVTQSAGLQPLTAARDAFGADLLVLVRKFEAPEQASCGSAWMLGGGQNPIDSNSAAFGMALVSDSSGDMFPDEGATCPEVMLAHELGHNMGQQHDVVTARGTDDSDNNGDLLDPEEFGHHAYSFGYSTDNTGSDIATIMSNRRLSQTRYRVFSNPLISACGGAPCGIADQADNVRSMAITMPLVAGFRAAIVSGGAIPDDINGDGRSDLIWRQLSLNMIGYWFMQGATVNGYGFASGEAGYKIIGTGDFNGDSRVDLLWDNGGTLRLWTSTGAGFTSALVASYGDGWEPVVAADANGDGRADIIWVQPQQNQLAYWLMNGASVSGYGFQQALAGYSIIGAGDFNGDAAFDLLWDNGGTLYLWTSNGSGFTSNLIASYGDGWKPEAVADVNGDGRMDIVWRQLSQNQMAFWLMNGPTVTGYVFQPGLAGYSIIGTGDFDGNGRFDLLWDNGGTVYAWLSTGSTFNSQLIASYGDGWTPWSNALKR